MYNLIHEYCAYWRAQWTRSSAIRPFPRTRTISNTFRITQSAATRSVFFMLFSLLLSPAGVIFAADATNEMAVSDAAKQTDTVRRALLAAARNALKQSDLQNAAFYYNRYLEQQPEDRVVALEFAGVLSQAERFQEAMDICESILRQYPNDPDAQRIKAMALGRMERPREALRIISDLRARFPQDVELQRIEAAFLAVQGDRRFSRDLYRELLAAGFNTSQDWQNYLQLLAADRQWDLAIETYDQYRERLAVNDDVRFAVLQARLARNEMGEAEGIFNALGQGEKRRDAAIMIADRMAAAGRLRDAVRFLEPLTKQPDPSPDLIAKIALFDAYDKRPARALSRLDLIPPEHHTERSRITRAKIFWAAGRPGDALAELDRLNLPEGQVEAMLTRAGLLYDLHREWEIPTLLARLDASLGQASAADRKLAWCLTTLAYIRFGDYIAARDTINLFKKREPDDLAPDILAVMNESVARHTLARTDAIARLGMRLREFYPGMELIRPALLDHVPAEAWRIAWNSRPNNPFALIALARAEEREGRILAAEAAYALAANKPETHADALLGRANCAWRMQDAQRLVAIAHTLQETDMNCEQLIQASEIMLRAGKDGLAESFFTRISPADASLPDACIVRATWLVRNERMTEARRLLAQVDPDNPAQIGALTYQYQRLAALARDASDPVFKLAREQLLPLAQGSPGPGRADGMLAAADILMQHNEWKAADALLRQLERTYPYELRVAERLIPTHIRNGQYTDAEQQTRKIMARRPGDATWRVLLARMSVWRSDYQSAWRAYADLIADYPEDDLLPLELAAKRAFVLGRHWRAVPLYAAYSELIPYDREMRVEEADTWLQADFSRAAATRYRAATWTFPNDQELRVAMDTAERRSNWGAYATADYLYRRGDDRKVDIRQDRMEAGARLPRGPDGMTLEAGIGVTQFRFDNPRAKSLNARILAARGRCLLTNGVDLAGDFEFLDYNDIDSNWRGEVDIGYRGLDGWKVALIAGRRDVRDNYYTILDGMQADWLGGYVQWQPLERLELFTQYRAFAIPAPQADALLPPRTFIQTITFIRAAAIGATNALPGTTPSTWEKNNAHEAVAEAAWQLSFFPQSLRLWVNGYLYNTAKENDMYWTPDGTFLSGQIGLHWRHSPGQRHFTGGPLFFYGVYAAVGRDTEGDTSPTLKAELGLNNMRGWSLAVDAGRVWGDKYEESAVHARLEYLF